MRYIFFSSVNPNMLSVVPFFSYCICRLAAIRYEISLQSNMAIWKFLKWPPVASLDLIQPEIVSAVRSAIPENPSLEPNMEGIV